MNQSEFNNFTGSFVGQKLSRLWLGDYTTFYAEVGTLSRTYDGSGRPKAERNIYFGWSWRVESRRSILFGSHSSDRRISNGLASLQGLIIESLSVCGCLPELRLQLSGGRWISTFATDGSQPDWTITLPDDHCVTVRRGIIIHADATRPIPK